MKIIEIKNISKHYKLGEYNLKTAIKSVSQKISGKKNIISENDRTSQGSDLVWALQNISFDVNAGEVVGIVGKNGAGKSTLLKILSRITAPSTGEICLHGRMGSLLEVGTGFHPDLTGKENIFLNGAILGMTKKEIISQFDAIVDFAGVQNYIYTPVKRYSSGMYVRLAFAVAAHLNPEILVVDEVLAVGDAEFQEKCVGKMKSVSNEGRTVLFVSHNMSTIRNLCTRGILLEKGKLIADENVENVISKYLQTNLLRSTDGSVPDNASAQNNGEGKITKINLYNNKNQLCEEFNYLSPIHLQIETDANIHLDDILIGIQIKSQFNETIEDFVNIYDNNKLQLQSGKNIFNIELQNRLLPGSYTLNITIARQNGVPIDVLESIAQIKIGNLGDTAEINYPFPWVNGYVKGEAKWN